MTPRRWLWTYTLPTMAEDEAQALANIRERLKVLTATPDHLAQEGDLLFGEPVRLTLVLPDGGLQRLYDLLTDLWSCLMGTGRDEEAAIVDRTLTASRTREWTEIPRGMGTKRRQPMILVKSSETPYHNRPVRGTCLAHTGHIHCARCDVGLARPRSKTAREGYAYCAPCMVEMDKKEVAP